MGRKKEAILYLPKRYTSLHELAVIPSVKRGVKSDVSDCAYALILHIKQRLGINVDAARKMLLETFPEQQLAGQSGCSKRLAKLHKNASNTQVYKHLIVRDDGFEFVKFKPQPEELAQYHIFHFIGDSKPLPKAKRNQDKGYLVAKKMAFNNQIKPFNDWFKTNKHAIDQFAVQLNLSDEEVFNTMTMFLPDRLLPKGNSRIAQLEALWDLRLEQKIKRLGKIATSNKINACSIEPSFAHVQLNFRRALNTHHVQGIWLYFKDEGVHLLLECALPKLASNDSLTLCLLPQSGSTQGDSTIEAVLTHAWQMGEQSKQTRYHANIQLPTNCINSELTYSIQVSQFTFDIEANPERDTLTLIEQDIKKRLMHFHHHQLAGREAFSTYFDIETINHDGKETFKTYNTEPFLYKLTRN